MNVIAIESAPSEELLRPDTVGNVGFKDWSVICDALGGGLQSLILRKGGIAEEREGFRFKHDRFFLMPTGFHQQLEKVVVERANKDFSPAFTEAVTVSIGFLFVLEFAYWIEDWVRIAELQAFHILREETVRERFEYGDSRGLQCAFGRVYRCTPQWNFPNRATYGGCRSWVTLPEPPAETKFAPVLNDVAHKLRRREIACILGHDLAF